MLCWKRSTISPAHSWPQLGNGVHFILKVDSRPKFYVDMRSRGCLILKCAQSAQNGHFGHRVGIIFQKFIYGRFTWYWCLMICFLTQGRQWNNFWNPKWLPYALKSKMAAKILIFHSFLKRGLQTRFAHTNLCLKCVI